MSGYRLFKDGDRFDQLTVVGFDTKGVGRNRCLYVCQCVCGKIVKKRSTQLKDNITNSCGCKHNGKWTGTGAVSKTYFGRIKRGAMLRGLSFKISIGYLAKLFEEQHGKCALTGLPIDFGAKTYDSNTASIDRIDNDRGYEEGNLWWVHKTVNRMRMDLSLEEFRSLCQLVIALI